MPTYLVQCTADDQHPAQSIVQYGNLGLLQAQLDSGAHPCPVCGARTRFTMAQTRAQTYIPERDRAVNHREGGKYREWLKSPETQERIRRGELQPERGTAQNPLSDHLDNL